MSGWAVMPKAPVRSWRVQGSHSVPMGGKLGDLGSHSALGRGCSCGAAAPEVSAISTRGLENKRG